MSKPNVRLLIRSVVVVALVALGFGGAVVQAAPAAQTGVVVEMQDNAFAPQTVTVPVGATITWRNAGQRPHTATADDGSFDTGRVESGASSSAVTFNQAGTFAYFCELHGGPGGAGMAGTVIVQAAQASPSPAAQPSAAASPAASASPAAQTSAPAQLPNAGVNTTLSTLLAICGLLALAIGLGVSQSVRRNSVR